MSNAAEDVLEIMALVAEYGERAGVLDATGQSQCYAENATCSGVRETLGIEEGPLVGRDAIRTFLAGTHETVEYLHQHAHLSSIRINGDTATARTQLTEFAKLKDGPLVMLIGNFDDTFGREGDGWLFTDRTLTPKRITALEELPFT